MIKLINLLELKVNPGNLTHEKVDKYWTYIVYKGTGEEFDNNYYEFLTKWRKKYRKKDILKIFEKLNRLELKEFYEDLKQLINK